MRKAAWLAAHSSQNRNPRPDVGVGSANNAVQIKIAEAHAAHIILACEGFHAANGRFPKSLDELVPRYIPSVPCAKYCLAYGKFNYEQPMMAWCVIPPFNRRVYNFETRRWTYID